MFQTTNQIHIHTLYSDIATEYDPLEKHVEFEKMGDFQPSPPRRCSPCPGPGIMSGHQMSSQHEESPQRLMADVFTKM